MITIHKRLLADLLSARKAQSGRFSLSESGEEPVALYALPSPEKQIEIGERGLELAFGNLLQKMLEQRRCVATRLSRQLAIGAFISNHEARPDSNLESNRPAIAIALALGQRLLEMSQLPQEKIDLLVIDNEEDERQARKIDFEELADPAKSAEELLIARDIGRRKFLWLCIEPREKRVLDAESEWTKLPIKKRWDLVDFDRSGAISKNVFAYLTGRSPDKQKPEKSSVGKKAPLVGTEINHGYLEYPIGSKALRKLIEKQTKRLLKSYGGYFKTSDEGDMTIYAFLHFGVYDTGIIDEYLEAHNLDVVLPLREQEKNQGA